MIRLNLQTEPTWIDLAPGISVLIDPIGTTALKQAGVSDDLRAAKDLYPIAEGDEKPDQRTLDMRFVHLVKAIAKIVVRDWKGVLDANGDEAPVTAAYIEALLELNPIYNTFVPHVTRALTLVTEKNG